MDSKIRINFSRSPTASKYNKNSHSANNSRGAKPTDSRSRSRLPFSNQASGSPFKNNHMGSGNLGNSSRDIRERSIERSTEKYQKSTLYSKEHPSVQDLPLLNTSYNNLIKLPQYQQEQDGRGRTRARDVAETAKKRGADIAVNNRERRESVESMEGGDDMVSLMGFGGFGSTKGKHVDGAKGGAIKHDTKTNFRQYMNRNKGFNRPLSPGR